MLQRWLAVGDTVPDLTGLRFEPQTTRSRDKRVTARPTVRLELKEKFPAPLLGLWLQWHRNMLAASESELHHSSNRVALHLFFYSI